MPNVNTIKWKKKGKWLCFLMEVDVRGHRTWVEITRHLNRTANLDELLMLVYFRKGASLHRADIRGRTLAKGLNELMLERFNVRWHMKEVTNTKTRRLNVKVADRDRIAAARNRASEDREARVENKWRKKYEDLLESTKEKARSNKPRTWSSMAD